MNSTEIQTQIDALGGEVASMKKRHGELPGLMVLAQSAAALGELHHEAEFLPFTIAEKEAQLLYLQLDLYEALDTEATEALEKINAELAPLVAERQEVEQRTGKLMAPLQSAAEQIHYRRESRRLYRQDAKRKLRDALEQRAVAVRLMTAPHMRALHVAR